MNDPGRTVTDLRARLRSMGARDVHVGPLMRAWLEGRGLDAASDRRGRGGGRTPRRSRALEAALPGAERVLDELVSEVHRADAGDGTRRRVLRLRSGRTIESVDLPRDGLCVSTQVGCAVGCRFCKTGEDGLLQQLSSLEILAQVVGARRERAVRRVVFMGMGEPANNLDAVLDAIEALGTDGGMAHKNLAFSTVGDPAVFDRLAAGRVRPALSLSLHSLDPEARQEMLPRAPRIQPRALLTAALDYADRVSHPLQVQWTLLAGSNDDDAQADRLADALRGRRAIVNYIPFNAVEGSGFERPPIDRCVELVRRVRRAGVVATLRFSAAVEVDGGCGQLRARVDGSGN
mgnify:CR=1 FL=1